MATTVKFIDQSTIEYEMPAQDESGEKDLVLIPIQGANLALTAAINITES
jgi:hypothetical protein